MVEARAAFLAQGHYAGIAGLVSRLGSAALAGRPADTCAVDLGAGTGYYLARVLEAADEDCTGIALDVSKYAARRAVRAHPRIGVVVADTWQSLPLRGRAASLVLNVFAPRNPAEMHRVLHPDGRAIVVVPDAGHLAELVSAFGLLSVDERKRERVAAQFEDRFTMESEYEYTTGLRLDPEQVATLIAMGPNAWHASSPVETDPARDLMDVTVAVRAYVLKRR
jgi:SAM-dependent methyltransferase